MGGNSPGNIRFWGFLPFACADAQRASMQRMQNGADRSDFDVDSVRPFNRRDIVIGGEYKNQYATLIIINNHSVFIDHNNYSSIYYLCFSHIQKNDQHPSFRRQRRGAIGVVPHRICIRRTRCRT